MNVFHKRLASAALLLSLTASGSIFAQDQDREDSTDLAAPPVAAVPDVPEVRGGLSRYGSRDWRGEVAADREAKGWGSDRPRSQTESRQNWIREYQRRDYYSGGQERWDRFRDPQDRSDRIGANRNSFAPNRPAARSDAETQAEAYAALYWMMKAQAQQEDKQER